MSRWRFLSLWIAEAAAAAADACVLLWVLLGLTAQAWDATSIPYLVLALFFLPRVVLAWINGAVVDRWPKGAVLVAATALRLAVLALPLLGSTDSDLLWLVVLAVTGAGRAAQATARSALLPIVSQDRRLPLPLVNGLVGLGSCCGTLVAIILGLEFFTTSAVLLQPAPALYALAIASALLVKVPSDVAGTNPVSFRSFLAGARQVWRQQQARNLLFAQAGLGAFGGAVLMLIGAVAADYDQYQLWAALYLLAVVVAGLAAGCLAACGVPHSRVLGWVPYGWLGLLLTAVWLNLTEIELLPYVLLGFSAGLVLLPVAATYPFVLPEELRGRGIALGNAVTCLAAGLMVALLLILDGREALALGFWLILPLVMAAVGTIVCWRVLLREGLEVTGEALALLLYRIRSCGPGTRRFPLRGPVIIVANHSAWFDPLWLGKVIPRRLIAFMGAKYYDLPVIHWLMRNVVHAIRVEESTYRHEAPELAEVVARLDRGECVMFFPEGRLRRDENLILRPFKQGVWRVLEQRPQTPVVPCWIDGSWGSFTSYRHGPPGRGKPFDWFRTITIAIGNAEPVPAEVLAEQKAARKYLMERVLELRQYLPGGKGATVAADTAAATRMIEEESAT